MIQAIPFQRARIPLLGLAALGLVAFGTTLGPRLSPPAAAPQVSALVESPAPAFAQRPLVEPATDNNACGAGAYVTGDMAGETSPAAIYSAMCGGR